MKCFKCKTTAPLKNLRNCHNCRLAESIICSIAGCNNAKKKMNEALCRHHFYKYQKSPILGLREWAESFDQ